MHDVDSPPPALTEPEEEAPSTDPVRRAIEHCAWIANQRRAGATARSLASFLQRYDAGEAEPELAQSLTASKIEIERNVLRHPCEGDVVESSVGLQRKVIQVEYYANSQRIRCVHYRVTAKRGGVQPQVEVCFGESWRLWCRRNQVTVVKRGSLSKLVDSVTNTARRA